MAKIAIVYHSQFGHTKRQAEAVHRGAAGVDSAEAILYTVKEATERMDELDETDAIIFGCPTYMGNVSAGMKAFQEDAAKKWFADAWKDKIAGAFTNSSSFSGDKMNTLTSLMVFAMQQGMIFVSLGMKPAENLPESMKEIVGPGPDAHNRVGSYIGPMASSFEVKPDAGSPSVGDIETAELYGKRVAEITLRLKHN